MHQQVELAMPLLEAVEHAALRAGVPVDARVESGRSPTHALRRLWEAEHFDRIVAPAPARAGTGFTPKELQWLLSNAPSETLILRPEPEPGERFTTTDRMTILVAYDGSAEAKRALTHAAELVGPGGSVSVVNVIPVQSISSTARDGERGTTGSAA